MSFENVKAFYERVASDPDFLSELQATQTQEEGQQILEEAGYQFTSEELEEYTHRALEATAPEDSLLEDLDEEQMAEVFGGLASPTGSLTGPVQALYGVIWLNPCKLGICPQPMYGGNQGPLGPLSPVDKPPSI